jgi:hypothetical protein
MLSRSSVYEQHALRNKAVEFQSHLEDRWMKFLHDVPARKLPSSPRHCVAYRREGISMDMSVAGGGRVDAVWRLRAPVQSRRLRIHTSGGSGEVPLCPPPCVLYKYTENNFFKKRFIRPEFYLFSSNNCFRGTHAETWMGCARLHIYYIKMKLEVVQ